MHVPVSDRALFTRSMLVHKLKFLRTLRGHEWYDWYDFMIEEVRGLPQHVAASLYGSTVVWFCMRRLCRFREDLDIASIPLHS